MKVFADSSYFISFYDDVDQKHSTAIKLTKELASQPLEVFTSDYIYDETITLLLTTHKYYGYLRTQQFDQDVLASGKFNFIRISDTLFQKGRETFRRYAKDKQWSFTDCTSYVIMKDMGIKNVLTFDKHFKQMGFKLIE